MQYKKNLGLPKVTCNEADFRCAVRTLSNAYYRQKQPPEMFCKIIVFTNFINFTGKHLCRSLSLIKLQAFRAANLLKETRTQVFSCEICEIFRNNYFEEHLQSTASTMRGLLQKSYLNYLPFNYLIWIMLCWYLFAVIQNRGLCRRYLPPMVYRVVNTPQHLDIISMPQLLSLR